VPELVAADVLAVDVLAGAPPAPERSSTRGLPPHPSNAWNREMVKLNRTAADRFAICE
jgi:hypothetical protein